MSWQQASGAAKAKPALVLPESAWESALQRALLCPDLAAGRCSRVRARTRAWRRAYERSGNLLPEVRAPKQ